jgi:hypothetical protein
MLEQGFTLLWVGSQFDVPAREGALRAYLPIAREVDGRLIQGLLRSDFEPVERTMEASLADRAHVAYAVVDPREPANVLWTTARTLSGRESSAWSRQNSVRLFQFSFHN